MIDCTHETLATTNYTTTTHHLGHVSLEFYIIMSEASCAAANFKINFILETSRKRKLEIDSSQASKQCVLAPVNDILHRIDERIFDKIQNLFLLSI